MSANLMGLIVRMLYGINSGFEGNQVEFVAVNTATRGKSVNAPTCNIFRYRTRNKAPPVPSKGLNLLSPSMQVLMAMDSYSTNGNRKQGGVAIVVDFKASTTREK